MPAPDNFRQIGKASMSFSCTLPKLTMFAAIALVSIAAAGAANAQSATELQLSYKGKKFDPGRSQRARQHADRDQFVLMRFYGAPAKAAQPARG
jgi:hypothetical protein